MVNTVKFVFLFFISMQIRPKPEKWISVYCTLCPDLICSFTTTAELLCLFPTLPHCVGTGGLMLIIWLLEPVLQTHMVSLGWIRIINHALLPVKNEYDTSILLHPFLVSEMSWTLGLDISSRLCPGYEESSVNSLSNPLLSFGTAGTWHMILKVLFILFYVLHPRMQGLKSLHCHIFPKTLSKTNRPTYNLFYLWITQLTYKLISLFNCGHPFTWIQTSVSCWFQLGSHTGAQALYEPGASIKGSCKNR